MEDSGYYSHRADDLQVCSASDSASSIFNLKFCDLRASKYNYFLYGFKDETDFEGFKQDLKDFQRLKRSSAGVGSGQVTCSGLKEDLELICRPNNFCQFRRKQLNERHKRAPGVVSTDCGLCPDSPSPTDVPIPAVTEDSAPKLDPFALKADFQRRSDVFGFERRSGISSGIRDILMDFLNGDEHFQEFERVFDTVNNRSTSHQMDNVKRLSRSNLHRRLSKEDEGLLNIAEAPDLKGNVAMPLNSDVFSDFFDHDETFLEFEKEFQKFRTARMSGVSHYGSSRDIFDDLKSYCDRKVSSRSLVSCEEAAPSCDDDPADDDGGMWRSVEDWANILHKMRRHSVLGGRSRRPKYGLSRGFNEPKLYSKTQSLADLTRFHGQCTKETHGNARAVHSYSVNDLSSTCTERLPSPGKSCSTSSVCTEDTYCSSHLSDKLSHCSSSSSTLCSSQEDLSCSLSCSCCSDLHIYDVTDDDDDETPHSRGRSNSLMDMGNSGRGDLGQLSSSVDNLSCLFRARDEDGRVGNVFSDDVEGVLGDAADGENDWSCQLSDVDSEQYHTANSDYFSTAKSDLSVYMAEKRSLPTVDRIVPSCGYHSYHGRERRKTFSLKASLSCEPACQYTCHQHCVPAVTLNCKSVSEDSVQVKTPSPAEPRPPLETSLSLGSLRPGCARIVTPAHENTVAQDVQAPLTLSSPSSLPAGLQYQGHLTARSLGVRPCQPQPSEPGPSPVTTALPVQSADFTVQSADSRVQSVDSVPQTIPTPAEVCQCVPDCSHEDSSISPEPQGPDSEANSEAATEKDETDSGYRSGTIPDDKLPRGSNQETIDHQELKKKIAKFNHFVPAACFSASEKESFQGFLKVTLNLIRPITMELGARPPSIYELLTREHIIEENTQQVAFYMPRDTQKSLHITSDTTTKEVVTTLLKKFHIIDHPRKFAMYEQEFSDRNKLVRLRRLTDKDFPLRAVLTWDPERIKNYRMVLQENETGEIVWEAFSLPELNNFMRVLDREEKETILELKHKYAYMKQYMERRLTELRPDRNKAKVKK